MTTRTALVYLLLILPVFVFIAFSLVELSRRRDISGVRKALWSAALILLPGAGSVVYLFARPSVEGDLEGFGSRPGRANPPPLLQAIELATRGDRPASHAAQVEMSVLRATIESTLATRERHAEARPEPP